MATRRERALETRRRMLHAAYRLFCQRGYPATTMDAIAAEADVAVQTLYFTFHTKGAILGESVGAAIIGFDAWMGPRDVPPQHDWWPRFEAEPDARRALELFVDHGVEPMARVAPLMAAIVAAGNDADARSVLEMGEKRRVELWGELIRLLKKKKGGLRRGLTVTRATDVMLALFSAPAYQALAERGWSPAECRKFFVDLLTRQLINDR